MEASYAAQKLIFSTLSQRAGLTAMVGENIFDRNAVPEAFPCILLGEAQVTDDDYDCRELSTIYATLHVWTEATGFKECKAIAGEVRRALKGVEGTVDGYELSIEFSDANYIRDKSGEHCHGVLSFEISAEDTVNI